MLMDLWVWDIEKAIVNSIPNTRRIELAIDTNLDVVDQQRASGGWDKVI